MNPPSPHDNHPPEPLLNFINSPSWPFWGVVVTILTIVVPFLIYYWQKQRKKISFDILSENQLLTTQEWEDLKEKLQVLYEGQPIRSICFLMIKIFNSGNVPIIKEEYEVPINIYTGEDSTILSEATIKKEPEDLPIGILSKGKNSISLQPILLNPKDSITLKILVSDFSRTSLKIYGRIAGVKHIERVGPTRGQSLFLTILGLIIVGFGLFFITSATVPIQYFLKPMKTKGLIGFVLFILGYFSIIYANKDSMRKIPRLMRSFFLRLRL